MEEKIAPPLFSETQKAYSKNLLSQVQQTLEDMPEIQPLLSKEEKENPDNGLYIHKYGLNAYRLTFTLKHPSGGVGTDERISKFDEVMAEIGKDLYTVGEQKDKLYNQIPNNSVLGKKRGYSSWEFYGVVSEPRDEFTTNQATILEISEMIGKKIGLTLDSY